MRHEGKLYEALRSTVGEAAKLTVKDNFIGRPVFGGWSPFPFSAFQAAPVEPPMRFSEVAGRVVAGKG